MSEFAIGLVGTGALMFLDWCSGIRRRCPSWTFCVAIGWKAGLNKRYRASLQVN